jgi:hypothetical protein
MEYKETQKMPHYAKIENDQITNVIVADQDFIDSGSVGNPTNWIKILDNNETEIYTAGIGYTYDAKLDAFIPPNPFNSWILNGTTWSAPVPYPQDNNRYMWDEKTISWIEQPLGIFGT